MSIKKLQSFSFKYIGHIFLMIILVLALNGHSLISNAQEESQAPSTEESAPAQEEVEIEEEPVQEEPVQEESVTSNSLQ